MGPLRDPFGQLPCFVVVAAHGTGFKNSGGAEENNRVPDFLLLEVRKRIEILAQNAQTASFGSVEKLLITIGKGQTAWNVRWFNHVGLLRVPIANRTDVPIVS